MKPYDERFKVTMVKVSPAVDVGDCWVCGRGKLWHRLFGWLLHHEYDPIREDTYAERVRLDQKHKLSRGTPPHHGNEAGYEDRGT